MSAPRWRDNESGSATIVCNFTWGDGHVCDQLIAIGTRPYRNLVPPHGYYFSKPDEHGVYPLRRRDFDSFGRERTRRAVPLDRQPRDNFDQPVWPTTQWGAQTGVRAGHVIGESPDRPARVRCLKCGQIRPVD